MPKRLRTTTGDAAQPLIEQEREIAQLHLAGSTMREIEARVGLDHSYCHRILRRPHVVAWIEDARRDADAALRRRFAALGGDALGVLASIMRDEDAPEAARIAAAKEVLARLAPIRPTIEGGEVPVRVDVRTTPDAVRAMTDDELREALARLEG